MYTAIFWLTGPTNQSQPIANLFNFYIFCPIWIKFGMWTTIGQKTTYDKFKIATATIWLTTTTKTAAQATGVGGVRGSRGRGIEGPQDFTIFSLRREPPLLVHILTGLHPCRIVEIVIWYPRLRLKITQVCKLDFGDLPFLPIMSQDNLYWDWPYSPNKV